MREVPQANPALPGPRIHGNTNLATSTAGEAGSAVRARAPAPLRVLSNRDWLDGRDIKGRPLAADVFPQEPAGFWRLLRVLRLWKYDAVVVDCDRRWLIRVCAAKKLLPFSRCRLLCVDPVLTRPTGWSGYLKFAVRRWLLHEVDRFVFYFKQTQELQRVFRIPPERIQYVPFKPNTLSALRSLETTDDGYFLACGRSNRDFRTLFMAFRDLPYECRVLAPWDELEQHGTRIEGIERPDNVTLVTDDGTAESWNRWISRAKAVVLPIQPGMLSPSGIGTYLVAMALGKCVVITESPATWEILDENDAVLVPARDPVALRAAITRVAEDETFRLTTARAGQAYAMSLGGEDRLRTDVLHELSELLP